MQSVTAQFGNNLELDETNTLLMKKMLESLSFTHITLLLPISESIKSAFYIIEAIKGTWSVRELKRQINSLLYERSGLSIQPELVLPPANPILEQQRGLVKE